MLIKGFEHLVELCNGKNQLDCFVALRGGLRSSKTLIFHPDRTLSVFNDIDDSVEEFDSLKEMVEGHSIIKEALEKNSFYVFDYEVKK